MASTYDILRALPGKGTDWPALRDALQAHYLEVYAQRHNGAEPWPGNTTDVWKAARGVRELRRAAMEAACFAVDTLSRKSTFLAPSEETLSWGGFLGGETLVWTDAEAEAAATAGVAAIIARVARGEG